MGILSEISDFQAFHSYSKCFTVYVYIHRLSEKLTVYSFMDKTLLYSLKKKKVLALTHKLISLLFNI